MTIAVNPSPRRPVPDVLALIPQEASMMPLEKRDSTAGHPPAPGAAGAPLADMVAATRSLLNAWDRAMSSWRANPLMPAHDPLGSPGGFERACFPPGAPAVPQALEPAMPARPGATPGRHDSAPFSIAPTHSLTAQMLDGFQVWLDGQMVRDLPRGKARSLLQVLLLQRRRPVSRQRLCAMFWPDAEPECARNSLNVTLHRLRRALGKVTLLRYSEEGYQLCVPGEIWLDVEHFTFNADLGAAEEMGGHTGAAITCYEAAAALYHADLLDAGEHEPALAAECQALRDRCNEVLERLAALREQVGDLHGCLRASLRHLAQDECNEGAHQRLMRCYARLGRPQLAERQYRACVTALRLQLGLHPSDETTALCRRIARRALI